MIILHNPTIVTAEKEAAGSIIIKDGKIADVLYSENEDYGFRMSKVLKENPEAEI